MIKTLLVEIRDGSRQKNDQIALGLRLLYCKGDFQSWVKV